MKPCTYMPLLAAASLAVQSARSAPGPVAAGPDQVRPNESYQIQLSPGPLTTGSWLIDWGDGTGAGSVPIAQATAGHT